jgi:hypothetical protein
MSAGDFSMNEVALGLSWNLEGSGIIAPQSENLTSTVFQFF